VPIPFIFLTARAEKEDLIKGKSLGVEDYIVKPFDPQELLTIVQARLGRAQAIQEASEMTFENLKRQIINTLSHELRTPLTYIQGYTTLALDESKTLDPEAFRDFLLAIKKGADRLTRLVEDMLLLVQLDTGQATEEFSALSCVQDDLSEIISRTVRQHETHASDEGIKLELQKPDTLPPIKICEIFLVEALSRLIDNAIRFSRDKGDQIIVSVQVQGEWMEIAVQDNGIGIAADQLPHLFERFRQFNREEMEQQGAGLGLSIAHELIALHSGEITVDSKPSEGSTFTIRLPLTQETS
jgi:signal transduction histidine kinase